MNILGQLCFTLVFYLVAVFYIKLTYDNWSELNTSERRHGILIVLLWFVIAVASTFQYFPL